jgi:hypothetical protein
VGSCLHRASRVDQRPLRSPFHDGSPEHRQQECRDQSGAAQTLASDRKPMVTNERPEVATPL